MQLQCDASCRGGIDSNYMEDCALKFGIRFFDALELRGMRLGRLELRGNPLLDHVADSILPLAGSPRR